MFSCDFVTLPNGVLGHVWYKNVFFWRSEFKVSAAVNLYIKQLANTWLVKFTPAKPESLLISRKVIKPVDTPLYMQNHEIKEVENHKHLGLYFSNDGTWHTHINNIKEKAWHRIKIMRKLKFQLDQNL